MIEREPGADDDLDDDPMFSEGMVDALNQLATSAENAIKQAQGYVAFEGMVVLAKWADSSTTGAKAYFNLTDRESLAPFEKATKRRGKRAGQRYMLVTSSDKGDVIPEAPTEAWFAGAQWSHQGGASITLTFEDLEFWRQFNTADQGEGQIFHFTMVELQANDTPLDQVQADRVERANRPKGGPHSKFVAQRNASQDFQAYIGYRTGMPRERWPLVGADTCDKWVKQMCGVASKVDFDHNPESWERYEKLISRPFITWAQAHYR